MIRPEHPLRPDDLMKTDLLSEILLVGSGLILFVPLLLILVTALTQSAALR
jgi:positive regulator of sigma E activity